MKVYRTHRAARTHFDPECPTYLRYRRDRDLVELELSDLKAVTFCRTCTPPELHHRPETHHTICRICGYGRLYPCEHNGGVPVLDVNTYTDRGKVIRRVYTRWRWAENVLGAPLARDRMLV